MTDLSDLAVLTKHGRSFRLAGRLLGHAAFSKAASLYAVCRAIDDLADESSDAATAGAALHSIREDLAGRRGSTTLGRRLLALKVDADAAALLVDAMLSDLQPVRMADEAALLAYAFGAAGTVGLMMCDVLEVTEAAARPYAIDLGIAMQLTNIARDVREDLLRDRLYLPLEWLPPGTTPSRLLDDRVATFAAVRRVLELAERCYRSGALGYQSLPGRAALAIPVAARLYQEIGLQILRRGPDYLCEERCFIKPSRRSMLVATCSLQQLWHRGRERFGRLPRAGWLGRKAEIKRGPCEIAREADADFAPDHGPFSTCD